MMPSGTSLPQIDPRRGKCPKCRLLRLLDRVQTTEVIVTDVPHDRAADEIAEIVWRDGVQLHRQEATA
jgi:hypothetical protein